MTLAVEFVYNGHDNAIEFILKEEGVAIDHRNITRLQVMNVANNTMNVIADSQNDPSAFAFNSGRFSMRLGHVGIAAGDYFCRLNVFANDAPNGIIWSPGFPIVVV